MKPSEFAETILGIKLYDFQKEFLDKKKETEKCSHEDRRHIAIIGMGVTWVVCNECDALVCVLDGYVRKSDI